MPEMLPISVKVDTAWFGLELQESLAVQVEAKLSEAEP